MSLSDPSFLAFFAGVFVLFYLLPGGAARLALLLAASLAFYIRLSGAYVSVLLLIAAIAYTGGLAMRGNVGPRRQRLIFIASLIGAATPLIVFKYGAFLLDASGIGAPAFFAQVVLPIGLSFFTFAALGYLIDVRLAVLAPERSALRMGLFVAFFPLVTAGPIERGGRLLPQLDLAGSLSCERTFAGLRLVFVGLVLKLLFADQLADPVAAVFGDPEGSPPLEKLVAIIFFAFNLYADFAGYSLIAIGCARMLGIEVQPNFRQPFLSQTIPEFWRTWHMSLSFWVRDYLFQPMRAHWRRSGHRGMIAATMLSFLILGVWHGAGWQFVILGLAFGSLAVGSIYTLKYRDAAYAALGVPRWLVRLIRTGLTFLLVALVLVLFRVNFLEDAVLFYRDIFSLRALHDAWSALDFALFRQGAAPDLPIAAGLWADWLLVAALVAGDVLVRAGITLERCPIPVQIVAYNVGLVLIVYHWMSSSVAPPFLYYKF